MPASELLRREHFAGNYLAWIVVRHFLPANLLGELCAALVDRASLGTLGLSDLFETSSSGGSSALASWAVRPLPRKERLDHFLQDVVRQMVWQGDQTAAFHKEGATPEIRRSTKSLEDALSASFLDIASAASAESILEEAPPSLGAVLRPLVDLGRQVAQAVPSRAETIAGGCDEALGWPLGAIVVKHLGDLCADVDEWRLASRFYDEAAERLTRVEAGIWSELVRSLCSVIAQSRASARLNLDGPEASLAILEGIAHGKTFGDTPLGSLNSLPDVMAIRWATRIDLPWSDERASVSVAPQFLDAIDLDNAYARWVDKDHAEAQRWFWATLRRQVALGSSSYSRGTKAAFGRSLIDALLEGEHQHHPSDQFRIGVRLLVESGRRKSVDLTKWTEALVQAHVDERSIDDAIACSRNAPGVLGERTSVVVNLFKHWIQALSPDNTESAGGMLSFLAATAQGRGGRFGRGHDPDEAALESLTLVAGSRPEFRSLIAREAAQLVVDRLGSGDMLVASKALELGIAFLDALDEEPLDGVANAAVEALARFEPSEAPWPVARPAMALLGSKEVLDLCRHEGALRARVTPLLLRYAIEAETEHASLMYLLRDLEPEWVRGEADVSSVNDVVSKLRARVFQGNSSRTAEDIVALLVAPAFSGAAGVRDAIESLHRIIRAAAAGQPPVAFSRAYRALMLLGEDRSSIASRAGISQEALNGEFDALFGSLLDLWGAVAGTASIFAGFSIPRRTEPNAAVIHNWTFASVGFARSLGREQEMSAALDAAEREPALETPISVARAIRMGDAAPELFDPENIRKEKQPAFYSALGHRLMLLGHLPEDTRKAVLETLLQQTFRYGPRGMDAGIFVAASGFPVGHALGSQSARAYRKRLENDAELRIQLAPMFDRLESESAAFVG
jgi:hypothetical protein